MPKTDKGMVFGTRNRKYWVLGPSWVARVDPGVAKTKPWGLSMELEPGTFTYRL